MAKEFVTTVYRNEGYEGWREYRVEPRFSGPILTIEAARHHGQMANGGQMRIPDAPNTVGPFQRINVYERDRDTGKTTLVEQFAVKKLFPW